MRDSAQLNQKCLDVVYDALLHGTSVNGPMTFLAETLEVARRSMDLAAWSRFASSCVASHPLRHLVHQDPLTRRCFYKPRGYAGDARMLDYIYGCTTDDDSTCLGRRLTEFAIARPASRAVRNRLAVLADAIDTTARRRIAARVLAVACGHLREAHLSGALRTAEIGELIALDQDAKSLDVVAAEFRRLPVRPVQRSVRDLIASAWPESGAFDLIYSAGLYDYLPLAQARRLTSALFAKLNPGGTLLIANFLPGGPDRGYMESFMAWSLIYRTRSELEAVCNGIAEQNIAKMRFFQDSDGQIGFIEISRT